MFLKTKHEERKVCQYLTLTVHRKIRKKFSVLIQHFVPTKTMRHRSVRFLFWIIRTGSGYMFGFAPKFILLMVVPPVLLDFLYYNAYSKL